MADDPIGRGIALNSHLSIHAIQTFVRQNYVVITRFLIEMPTAMVARCAANFEDVSKIGVEKNRKWKRNRLHPIIYKFQFLVCCAVPQESRTQQMQSAAMDGNRTTARNIEVRKIGGEQEIIRFDSRTQQQRTLVPEPQRHLRQISRAFVKNALFA